MSDRCYVAITVRRADVPKWQELGYDYEFAEEEYEGGEAVKLADVERSWGVSDSATHLVPDCPMYGYHLEGGNYEAYVFAYDGKTFKEHVCNRDGRPVVAVGPDGPFEDAVTAAKEFLKFHDRADKMVHGAAVESAEE